MQYTTLGETGLIVSWLPPGAMTFRTRPVAGDAYSNWALETTVDTPMVKAFGGR